MPPTITFKFKTNEASAALARLSKNSVRSPSYLVDKFVFSMALRARKYMPKGDPSKIEAELGATKAHELVVLRSGKFSKAKKHLRTFFTESGKGSNPDVPLLALIINSRVSKTGFWHRDASPFKGVSRAEGARLMLEAMRKSLAARKSSAGYFKTAAAVIMFIFKNAKGARMSAGDSGNVSISSRRGKIADGTTAKGSWNAIAKFWNSGTRPDSEGKKRAIYAISQPIWQRAMDEEAASTMKFAIEQEFRQAAKQAGIKTN